LTAFALIGVAAGLRSEPGRGRLGGIGTRRRALLLGAGSAAAVAAAASLAFPWLATRFEARAVSSWRADPATAYAELDRAGSLNPLSDRPYVLRGAIASRLDDETQMRSSFERAIERNPYNWYAQLELAIALSRSEPERAARHAARAAELNPSERLIRDVQASIAAGKPIDPDAIDAALLEQVEGL
jgi:hypothetical protein